MSTQRVLLTGATTGMDALASTSLARARHTAFAFMRDPHGRSAADAAGSITVPELGVLSQESADEIVRIIDLPRGQRPRRAIADGSNYGTEIVNGTAEELRLRMSRRMGLTTPTEPGRPGERTATA